MENKYYPESFQSGFSINYRIINFAISVKELKKYIFPLVFLSFVGLSYFFHFPSGKQIGLNFWMFFKRMISAPR
jgi:hypothetical protein